MFVQKKIIVPAAGVKQRVDMAGLALAVAQMNLYETIEQVPKLIFDSENNSPIPLFPQSVYTGNQGSLFQQFFVEGTAESEGDEITFLISDDCMEQVINPVLISVSRESLIATFEKATTDVVTTISDIEITNPNGQLAKSIVIQPKGDSLRYAFNVSPVSGAFGFLLPVGEQLRIEGTAFIQALRFINDTAATQVTLVIQAEF